MGKGRRENDALVKRNGDLLAVYGSVSSHRSSPAKLRYIAIICIKRETVLCDETFWKHDQMRKIPHRETGLQWMKRKKWMSGDELDKDTVFKELKEDSGIVYYFNFSKNEGYGFVVATTETYPEKWVYEILKELFDTNKHTYSLYDSDGLRDIYVTQFANNLDSLRIKYEDFEHLEGYNLPRSLPANVKEGVRTNTTAATRCRCNNNGKIWLALVVGLAAIAAIVVWLVLR
eukprot:gb/GECG01014802.1/.p1 GENE.gb/GECG01014802.1/~~gb/GECG01014802.1/.p1  ORF type:complete len:231 (+),score=24.98 gb/GECG01014802.1/:1-693(+)